MATENLAFVRSMEFAEDVSTQYLVAKQVTAKNQAGIADAASDVIIGVFQNTGVDGEAAAVAMLGVSKVLIGTSGVSKNAFLTAESGGSAVATTTLDELLVGKAMEAGDDGDIIPCWLMIGATYGIGATA